MHNATKKHLIYVAGPTASGKTDVAIKLAQWLDTEIISCDSRQFFKELKIGAAPPTASQLATVKHHFVQHLSVQTPYTAGAFGRDANAVLNKIFEHHDCAVLVGGSGLYANALLYGFDDLPQANNQLREYYANVLKEKGIDALQALVLSKDAAYYQQVDINNPHRLIRALEVMETTKMKYSNLLQKSKSLINFSTTIFVMDVPRDQLYARINNRVLQMVANGLEAEACHLQPMAHLQSLNTVGYKEWFAHFNGEIDADTAIAQIQQNTRRFAKRQLTWFRRYADAIWLSPDAIEEMKSEIKNATNKPN